MNRAALRALPFGLVTLLACGSAQTPPPATPPPPHTDGHEHGAGHEHGPGHEHGGGHEHGPLLHRFEKADEWAPRFDDPARDEWQKPKDVVAAMDIKPGMTVADLGAGTGYFEKHLSAAVGASGAVLALDVEPDMVRYMTERAKKENTANVKPGVVPMDDPKLPAGGVDRVLIVDTWHHIADRPAYAAKLKAGLKDTGKVFIVDFKLESKHGPPKNHRVTPEDVMKELVGAGLKAQLSPTALPEQYIVVGTR